MTDKERTGYYLMSILAALLLVIITTLQRERIDNLESRIKTLEENASFGEDTLTFASGSGLDTLKTPFYRIKIVGEK